MQDNTCAVCAAPLERIGRPEIPKEIACAECHKCGYARTGDFCFFSDGTCLRSIAQAISRRDQQRYKQRLEEQDV